VTDTIVQWMHVPRVRSLIETSHSTARTRRESERGPFDKERTMTTLRALATAAAAAAGVCGFALFATAAPTARATASQHRTTRAAAPHSTPNESIRPFHVHFTDAALADLKRRIVATRWPEQETVTDA
jgi:hypothetical protein